MEARVDSDGYPLAERAHLINVSRQGVALAVDPKAPCDQGNVFKITTYLPGELLPITFEGKVAWIRQEDAQRVVGLGFQKIDPRNKSDLLEHAYLRWYHNMSTH